MPANEDHCASKQLFKYINNGKPVRKAVELLYVKGVKGTDGDDDKAVEKLSEFFTSDFTAEIFREISTSIALSSKSGREARSM